MDYPTAEDVRDATKTILRATNTGWSYGSDERTAFIDEILHDHTTLVSQLAKATGEAVFQRATGMTVLDFVRGKEHRTCQEIRATKVDSHPVHDMRVDCGTVVGAKYMACQRFI